MAGSSTALARDGASGTPHSIPPTRHVLPSTRRSTTTPTSTSSPSSTWSTISSLSCCSSSSRSCLPSTGSWLPSCTSSTFVSAATAAKCSGSRDCCGSFLWSQLQRLEAAGWSTSLHASVLPRTAAPRRGRYSRRDLQGARETRTRQSFKVSYTLFNASLPSNCTSHL